MLKYTRVYANIDLDAIVYNMESMQKSLEPGTGMIGVVKVGRLRTWGDSGSEDD